MFICLQLLLAEFIVFPLQECSQSALCKCHRSGGWTQSQLLRVFLRLNAYFKDKQLFPDTATDAISSRAFHFFYFPSSSYPCPSILYLFSWPCKAFSWPCKTLPHPNILHFLSLLIPPELGHLDYSKHYLSYLYFKSLYLQGASMYSCWYCNSICCTLFLVS